METLLYVLYYIVSAVFIMCIHAVSVWYWGMISCSLLKSLLFFHDWKLFDYPLRVLVHTLRTSNISHHLISATALICCPPPSTLTCCQGNAPLWLSLLNPWTSRHTPRCDRLKRSTRHTETPLKTLNERKQEYGDYIFKLVWRAGTQ